MSVNDLVYKMAQRARALADSSILQLRMDYTGESTPSACRSNSLGMTRGQMVEAVLCEEFCEEFSRNIEE